MNPNKDYGEIESATSQLKELLPATESEIHKYIVFKQLYYMIWSNSYFCPGEMCLPWICSISFYNKNCQSFHTVGSISLIPQTYFDEANSEKTVLITKSLDHNVLKNYRPVSNLPFLSKIMEKTVCNRLIEYLIEYSNNLYEPFQPDYHKRNSTETAFVKLHNDLLMNIDSNRGVVLIPLDLSAAFDTIDYSLMIKRLENRIGVKTTAL